ncbi:uncharacterized protein LOC131244572 [Magnolia sinica]|uniref:uncharacterized protein LOC131244572 n=1 Tax=Magnolia sinica TaxID=86752 RepID=UPI0026596BAB|nr:uncharacterized protein LOC131244572 [Magnolia sinica]
MSPQKAIKGQALADHLATHSLPDYQPLKTFFPDEDILLIEEEEGRKTKDEKLIPYHVYLKNLAEEFKEITFSYMPRIKNQFADALATLASMLEIPKGVAEWELTVELQEEPAFCLQIDEAEPPSNDQ